MLYFQTISQGRIRASFATSLLQKIIKSKKSNIPRPSSALAALPSRPVHGHAALHGGTGGSALATSPPQPRRTDRHRRERNPLLSPAWKLFWRHIYGVLSIHGRRERHFLVGETRDQCASERRGRGLKPHLPTPRAQGIKEHSFPGGEKKKEAIMRYTVCNLSIVPLQCFNGMMLISRHRLWLLSR